MKSRAAVLWEIRSKCSVEEIELDPPKAGEVLVRLSASGICHSDAADSSARSNESSGDRAPVHLNRLRSHPPCFI